MKIYGPYTRKDGRSIIIKYDGKSRITQSYPRYLLEQHLGRKLLPTEEVDHVDHDYTNNDISNLQILSKAENCRKESSRPHRARKIFKGVCPECGEYFEKYLNYVKNNLKQGRAGPYCSRSCAGKANARKQYV